jgi:hypothetical protein
MAEGGREDFHCASFPKPKRFPRFPAGTPPNPAAEYFPEICRFILAKAARTAIVTSEDWCHEFDDTPRLPK